MIRENSRLLSSVIEQIVREDHLDEGLVRVRVFDAWDLVVSTLMVPYMGKEAASRLTVRKYFKDGVLSCRMSSSVVRTQLSFQRDLLVTRINSALQGDYVKKIMIS